MKAEGKLTAFYVHTIGSENYVESNSARYRMKAHPEF